MKKLIRQMVQQKFHTITSKELIKYGQQYDFTLTEEQATKIINYVKKKDLDPFKESDRFKLLKKISHVTDEKTAKKAYKLFNDMIKQYGVKDMF
ncbi:two-component SAPR family response regulator [Salirhabdus euzebyi]|uniref:Two-component SAPR family response regulator n=1 Tax=Salirhabdus euzebyi TaxID=394506 RepID=A0A841Q7E1_9BACI|nr:DUF2624 domain-containing protein [Salirhabdus euzebyi]MBB6454295.1 two-component SAPR family response regulator [Salirhabdus euzebyi]